MKILAKKLSLTIVSLSISSLSATSLSWASSHREAPMITLDRTIDTTDVYAFRNQPDDDMSKRRLGTIQNLVPAMSIGDVNGDEIPDVVISNSDKVSVFIGNGDGSFDDQIDTPVTGANFLQVIK